jgi:hypothetical protein
MRTRARDFFFPLVNRGLAEMVYNDLVPVVRIVRFLEINNPVGQRERQKQVDALCREGWAVIAVNTVGEYGEHCDAWFQKMVPTKGVVSGIEADFPASPGRGDVRKP